MKNKLIKLLGGYTKDEYSIHKKKYTEAFTALDRAGKIINTWDEKIDLSGDVSNSVIICNGHCTVNGQMNLKENAEFKIIAEKISMAGLSAHGVGHFVDVDTL